MQPKTSLSTHRAFGEGRYPENGERGGIPKMGRGDGGIPQNDKKKTVLRMGLPIVENLSGPQESIFTLF